MHVASGEIRLGLRLEGGTARAIAIVAGKVRRNSDAGCPEAIEDVIDGAHVHRRVRDGLEHRVDETGKDVVDFGSEEGEEAIVSISEDGEEIHQIDEVVARTERKRVGVLREERKDVG